MKKEKRTRIKHRIHVHLNIFSDIFSIINRRITLSSSSSVACLVCVHFKTNQMLNIYLVCKFCYDKFTQLNKIHFN